MPQNTPDNSTIADILDRIADLLDVQNANPFKVRAYRNGAKTVRNMEQSAATLVKQEGRPALEKLPDIGESLASVIAEVAHTGRSSLLDRLEGDVSPETLFTRVPGIGEELAGRIVSQLDIHTLEELELAAYDGRLAQVEGFGPKRLEAVRVSLAGMLNRSAQRRKNERIASGVPNTPPDRPPVDLLLKVDADYRQRAQAGDLKTIAPKRFNSNNEAWLPIMHTDRAGWSFTALYSNTARAHDLHKTHDWVVIYYERNGTEKQNTIVTETGGSLKGKRVIRGREEECRRFYGAQTG